MRDGPEYISPPDILGLVPENALFELWSFKCLFRKKRLCIFSEFRLKIVNVFLLQSNRKAKKNQLSTKWKNAIKFQNSNQKNINEESEVVLLEVDRVESLRVHLVADMLEWPGSVLEVHECLLDALKINIGNLKVHNGRNYKMKSKME